MTMKLNRIKKLLLVAGLRIRKLFYSVRYSRFVMKLFRYKPKTRRWVYGIGSLAVVAIISLGIWLASSSSASPQTVSLDRDDFLSGTSQFGGIQLGSSGTDIRLQNGVVGNWNNTTGLQTVPSLLYGISNLTYGPNDTLYLMTQMAGQCHFNRYDIEYQAWTAVNTPPVACGSGTILVYDGVSSLYYAPGGPSSAPSDRFFRYDISDDSWHELESFTSSISDHSYGIYVSQGSNKYVYMFRGMSSPTFWRYSVNSNSWQNLPSFPTSGDVSNGIAAVWDGSDTIYAIANSSGEYKKYSISSNTWSNMTTVSGSSCQRHSLSYVNDSILAMRLYWCNERPSLTSYSVASNTWSNLPTPPSTASVYDSWYLPSAYDGSRYLYTIIGDEYRAEIYRYDTTTQSWDNTSLLLPAQDNTGSHQKMIFDGTQTAYYFGGTWGSAVDRVYKYDISTRQATRIGSQINTVSGFDGVYYDGSLYVLPMPSSVYTFQRYDTATNSLVPLADLPYVTNAGADIIDGGDGYLYVIFGGSRTNFYRYNIATNVWSPLGSMPQAESSGGGMSRIGRKIYVLAGAQSGFLMQYNMDTSVWSTIPGMPNGDVDHGGFITSDGSQYLYVGVGGRFNATSKRVYRYDTTNLIWQRIADLPAVAKPYASSFYDIAGNRLFVSQGQVSSLIWDWSPGADTYVKSGAWYSKTYDLKQVDTWTSLSSTISGTGTAIIYTRSSPDGNVWSAWQQVSGTTIASPVNRYLQIKITLSGDGAATPTVSDISLQYNQENTPPTLPSQLNAYSQKDGTQLNSGQTYEYEHPYFSWSGAADGVNGSGVAGYYIYFGVDSNGDPAIDGTYQTGSDYTISEPMTAGEVYYLRIKVKDNLGNTSSAATFFSYRYFYISPPGNIVKTSDSDFTEGINTNVAITGGSMKLESVSTGAWSTGSMVMPPENTTGAAQKIVDDYLYVARGSGTTTFWRYNLVNQTWATLSPVPVAVSSGSTMTYDNNGNLYLIVGNNTNFFYKYDVENNIWTSITSLPSNAQAGTDIVYIGNNKFIIMFAVVREFYQFDLNTMQFMPLQSYPTTITYSGSGLWYDGNDTIYAYFGSWYWGNFSGSGRTNIAKYSISTDSWRNLATSPISSVYVQNNLVSDGRGGLYVFANNMTGNLKARQRMIRYDIASETWSEVSGMTDQVYTGSIASDNKRFFYILPGGSGTNSRRILRYDTWTKKFTPGLQQIDVLDRIPYDSPINGWQWVGGNSSTSIYDGSKYIYAIAGGESSSSYSKFVKFDFKTGETIYLPAPPLIGIGGSLGYIDSTIYYMPAKNTRDFYRYDETLSQWIGMSDVPANVYRAGPSSLVTIGGSMYAALGNGRNYYKYTPDGGGGVWTKLTDVPGSVLNGASAYNSSENAVYVLAGNGGRSLYRYDVGANTWSTKANVTVASSQGAAMTISNGKIYAQIGNITRDSYVYDISSNTWSAGTQGPENFRYGSTIIKITETMALALPGQASPSIWQFNYPSAVTAFNGLATHISQPFEVSGMYDYAGIAAQVSIPNGTSVELWTRSSVDGVNWDDWMIAEEIKQSPTSISGKITSTARRFTQVKVILQSDDNVSSPVVDGYTLSYYFDVDPPSNPSILTAYEDSSKVAEIENNKWYNYPKPVFDWPDPGQPGGATDGPLGSHIGGYWVYVGTDPTASPRTSGIFVSGTEYEANLSISGSYYVLIQAQDMTGNVDSNIYSPFVYKFDNTPPTNPNLITVTPSGFTTRNNFTFEWPNSYDAHSGVAGYCYHTGATSGPFSAEVCQPEKILTDISAAYRSGTNVFYLRSYDNAGNYSSSYTTVSYYYATDPPGPVTNFRAIPPTSTSNLFSFAWDLPVQFSGDPDLLEYCFSINVLPSALNTTCTFEKFIPAFKAATQRGTNIIYIVAKDEAGNANWNNFASANFIANTVSPGIPLNLSVTDTSDRITNRWSLTLTWDKPTFEGNGIDGYIVERSEDGHTFTRLGNTSTLAFVDLDIVSGVMYSYRVRAYDNVENEGGASGIVSKSAAGNFASPPQIVSQPTVTVGFDQAAIKWVTSRESTSFVYYGTSPSDLSQSKGSLELLTEHSQVISGLQPSTTYYFRVQSFDNERTYQLIDAYSTIGTFRTTESARIYDVAVSDITSSSAVISWRSSVPTQSNIQYGSSLDYEYAVSDESTSFSSNHTYKLDSLNSGSLYHFRITSTTDFGSHIQSDDYTLETIARPQISNIRFQPIMDQVTPAVEVTWTTNVPTSSTVSYSAYGSQMESSLSELTTNHRVVISGLASNTTYQMTILGRDQYGNLVSSSVQTWSSQVDTRPPVISKSSYSVIVTSTAKGSRAQLIASWKTDEPSTSQISYGQYSSKSSELDKKTPIDTEPTTNHVVIISDLNLADIYKAQIVSKDLDGNAVYSSITTLVTPDKEVSLLENVLNLMVRLFTF